MAVAADATAGLGIEPDLERARELARDANVIPVSYRFVDDCETPVSAFLKLRQAFGGPAFLLESAEQGRLGRYSFLGFRPHAVLGWNEGVLKQWEGDAVSAAGPGGPEVWGDPAARTEYADPYAAVGEYFEGFRIADVDGLPPFAGGAVGYFGYDLVRAVERLGPPNPDPLGLPDMSLMICRLMLVFDHTRHEVAVIAYAFTGDGDVEPAHANAVELIEEARAALRAPVPTTDRADRSPAAPGRGSTGGMPEAEAEGKVFRAGAEEAAGFVSNMAREEFEASVGRIVEYIRAGDAYQVVPSQRFTAPAPVEAFSIYRGLRTVNPSPYMYFLDFGDFQIAGASPEPLVKVTGTRVETRPIAGTYPRGASEEEDRARAERLLEDPKERAEHVMLVDLGRNDIGRVCEYGSVTVDEMMVVETYSHVLHIVSHVSGTLREGVSAMDTLRAVLPAGTLSGAPKVRAMEIIDELEPHKRCSYGGAVGYLSFTGDLDTAIHIRTVVVKDGLVHVQAGGGTVVDAKPDYEYEESVNKAKAIFEAIELAAAQPEWG
jgi:anthranilate synthase component 1